MASRTEKNGRMNPGGGELSQPPAPENFLAYEFDLISFWVETTFLKDGFWNVSFREGVFTY